MSARKFHVVPVPCLKDNYAYLILDKKTHKAAVVDPVEPRKVLAELTKQGFEPESLTHVLTTHYHSDHSGGNVEMSKTLEGISVVGGTKDDIPAANKHVTQDDEFEVGSLKIRVLETPCHTKGHVLYYVTSGDKVDSEDEGKGGDTARALFTGDTLFTGGCGRFFEGSAKDMYNALYHKLNPLPDTTHVYCGHEYTVSNLSFAAELDQKNTVLSQKLKWAQAQREKGLCTQPSTLGEEKQYNPFLRVHTPAIIEALGLEEGTDPVAVLKALRETKDGWGVGSSLPKTSSSSSNPSEPPAKRSKSTL